MMSLAFPTLLLAISTLVSAAPPQARSGAVNEIAAATVACSVPQVTNSPSNDWSEQPTSCSQQRIVNQIEPPWGNGLPPRVTISPRRMGGGGYDKAACQTNYKLLTKMEDDFMKSVSRSRKNRQFDTNRPEFAVLAGACVTSDFTGYANEQDRYRTMNPYRNGGDPPPAPAAPTPWNDGWNGAQNPQPAQPYTAQPWQPPPGEPSPPSQWGQAPPPLQWGGGEPPLQSQWGPPAPQSRPWEQPVQSAQSQWEPAPDHWQTRPPAQNQPQDFRGARGWQPYTATVTVAVPSQPQGPPPFPQQGQW